MKPSLAILPVLLLSLLVAGTARAEPSPGTERERQSYAVGADLGRRLRSMSVDVDPALVAKGIEDALAGRTAALSSDEIAAALAALQAQTRARQAAALAARAGEAHASATEPTAAVHA